jgi:hypothetical protein
MGISFRIRFQCPIHMGGWEEHKEAAFSRAGTFAPKGPRRVGLVLHTFYSGFLTTDFADELIEDGEGVEK